MEAIVRLAGAVSLFATAPALAQAPRELSTDRPDKTESPFTVPAGRFQIELDFASITSDRDTGFRTETLSIAPVNIKTGLDDRTDLQIVFEPYVQSKVAGRLPLRRERRHGVGDLVVRLKRNLWGNDGGATALAIMPFVKLPTSSNGFGNKSVEGGLIVPLAIEVSRRVGIGLMTEIDAVRSSRGGGYSASFINSATVAFELTGRLGLYTELFTEQLAERGADWTVTADAGLTYALADDVQLDGGVNLGVTDAADDLNIFLGLSFRF